MKQYLELLEKIDSEGVVKQAARENMPYTKSIFGYQFKHDLQKGFPLLTTKKLSFNHIKTELIWFLRGDTNIKFLIDNNCNIWNQDAYNYYKKLSGNKKVGANLTFEAFIDTLKTCEIIDLQDWFEDYSNYTLGDCGNQYGRTWRNYQNKVDQIKNVVHSIINNPSSRRHIVSSIDPISDKDLALYWCHSIFQFNCRPIHYVNTHPSLIEHNLRPSEVKDFVKNSNIPKYYLDCQMYQRSADVFLGVPYNIASYALLTHIIAKICNMEVGNYIHTFGDVHIYETHIEQVKQQLSRKERELPSLNISNKFDNHITQWEIGDVWNTDEMITCIEKEWFTIENYNPLPSIKAKLSTGLK